MTSVKQTREAKVANNIGLAFLLVGAAWALTWYVSGGRLLPDYPAVAFVILGFFAVLGGVIGHAAQRKGRSFWAFFWLSVLVSPIIMGIIAVTLKPLDSSDTVPSATAPKPHGNLESKLVELQNLKEKGILSEAEFNEAKRKTLGL